MSTCDSMIAERLVTATSCSFRSAPSPSLSTLGRVRSLSTVWTRFCSCRLASALACCTSSSISPISRVRRSTSRRALSAISRSGSGSGSMATGGSVLGHANPALSHGVDDGLGAVVHAQLSQDAGHVVLDGLLADRKGVGHLLVRHSLGDVVENLDLARGKRSEDRRRFLAVYRQFAELLEDAARHRGLGKDLVVDEVFAAGDATDDRDEIVGSDVLEDERGRPGLDRVEERVFVFADGENDDSSRRKLALDPLGRLDSARSREGQVHEDDVRRELDREVEGAASVLGIADDLEVVLAFEDIAHPDSEKGVVIDQKDGRFLAGTSRHPSAPLRSGVIHRTHALSSPTGMDSQTTVPPPGRDRTSNLAPMSSARSRMNWRPKLRRPRAATALTSNPLPSSLTSRIHLAPSSLVDTMVRLDAACLRMFCSASCTIRKTAVCCIGLSTSPGALSSVSTVAPVSAAMLWTASMMEPSRPSSSSSGGRSWLMNVRTSPSSRRSSSRRKRSSLLAIRTSSPITRSMYSTWKMAFDSA